MILLLFWSVHASVHTVYLINGKMQYNTSIIILINGKMQYKPVAKTSIEA
jgi:hypothetical protein